MLGLFLVYEWSEGNQSYFKKSSWQLLILFFSLFFCRDCIGVQCMLFVQDKKNALDSEILLQKQILKQQSLHIELWNFNQGSSYNIQYEGCRCDNAQILCPGSRPLEKPIRQAFLMSCSNRVPWAVKYYCFCYLIQQACKVISILTSLLIFVLNKS